MIDHTLKCCNQPQNAFNELAILVSVAKYIQTSSYIFKIVVFNLMLSQQLRLMQQWCTWIHWLFFFLFFFFRSACFFFFKQLRAFIWSFVFFCICLSLMVESCFPVCIILSYRMPLHVMRRLVFSFWLNTKCTNTHTQIHKHACDKARMQRMCEGI